MPITTAHPALILPFRRFSKAGGWSSSLFWGSVSPDLSSLVLGRQFAHSLLGLALLDIPLTILLAFLWHGWGSRRLERLPGIDAEPRNSFSWMAALAGASLGGATHLLWDLFTHGRSPLLQGCSVCSTQRFQTVVGPLLSWPLHSALGMLVLALWLLGKARRAPGWPRIFLRPSWLRLALLPPMPLLVALIFFHSGGMHLQRIRRLCAVSGALALCVFAWETRFRPRTSGVGEAK